MLPNYNINPKAQAGQGAYGKVPGTIGLPADTFTQVNQAVPAATKTATGAANVINSEVAGQVTPETQNLLQNKAAERGVAGGVQGSDFSTHNFLQSLGLDAQALQHTGVSDYLSFLTGVGQAQTDPNLAVNVATQNALDSAAPDPQAAAEAQLGAFYAGANPPSGATAGLNKLPFSNNTVGSVNKFGFASYG